MSDRKIDGLLFNYETTARTDFQCGEIKPLVKTEYKKIKPDCARIRPAPLKDTHTLTDWRVPNVSFNLFCKNETVHRVNPMEPQMPYYEPEKTETKNVQKTRPRLVMTPAVKIDDIKEPERQVLINDIYTSSTMKQMREPYEIDAVRLNVKSPLPIMFTFKDPLSLKKLTPPYVSPEWRMDSASWDNRSLRTFVDPTKEFWLGRHAERKRRNAVVETNLQPS